MPHVQSLFAKIVGFLQGTKGGRGVQYKEIVYARHARRRMKWRQISEQEIVQTLDDPDKLVPLEENKYHVYKLIGLRNIRVTYRFIENEVHVLTVVDKSD